jgi:hypothetical protein
MSTGGRRWAPRSVRGELAEGLCRYDFKIRGGNSASADLGILRGGGSAEPNLARQLPRPPLRQRVAPRLPSAGAPPDRPCSSLQCIINSRLFTFNDPIGNLIPSGNGALSVERWLGQPKGPKPNENENKNTNSTTGHGTGLRAWTSNVHDSSRM